MIRHALDGNNYTEANKLASRLNIKSLPRSINFPVGTMFWAKKGALKNLYNLDLDWDDYPLNQSVTMEQCFMQ